MQLWCSIIQSWRVDICSCFSVQGFQQKFAFHSKDIVAISCSWCKQAVSMFRRTVTHSSWYLSLNKEHIEEDNWTLVEPPLKLILVKKWVHYDWSSVIMSFPLLVPQQSFLLHAAANWGGLSNRSTRCSHSSTHMDHSNSASPGICCHSLFTFGTYFLICLILQHLSCHTKHSGLTMHSECMHVIL